VNNWI